MNGPRVLDRSDLTTMRDQNAKVLVSLLLDAPRGLTRSDLERRSGLAHGTVAKLIHHLAGVLVDAGYQNGRGRPGKAWSLAPESAFGVGIDIGREHVAVAMVDVFGRLVSEPVRVGSADTLGDRRRTLKTAARLLKKVVQTEERCRRIAGVTIGVPAPVVNGRIDDDTYDQWHQVDIAGEMLDLWIPGRRPTIEVDNDANVGAVAERFHAAHDSLLYVKWSTAVGCGIVLSGALWRGVTGVAGELGHVKVRVGPPEQSALGLSSLTEWPVCERCGQIDCLDVLIGAERLVGASGAAGLADLLSRARRDDERALEVIRAGARLIGRALGATVTMLNVPVVILGGSIGGPAFDLYEQAIADGLQDTAVTRAGREDARFAPARLVDAPALGAAQTAIARHRVAFLVQECGSHEATVMDEVVRAAAP